MRVSEGAGRTLNELNPGRGAFGFVEGPDLSDVLFSDTARQECGGLGEER